MSKLQHYGWLVSPYSAKTRSYLHYAGVPFNDIVPSLKTLLLQIKPAVGEVIMPTVRLTNGQYLKDSSNIIDYFEQQRVAPTITPEGAKQRIVSAVLEVYADEWLPLPDLHYRWNKPENARFAISEFGKSAAPWLPKPLQRIVGQKLASKMQSYLPVLGITPASQKGIERITEQLLDDMDDILSKQYYLLGNRPSLADFSLYGPLFAHLYRDPASNQLFTNRKSLSNWIQRMKSPVSYGDFLENDTLADGIERILQRVFAEQWHYLQQIVQLVDNYVSQHPSATRVPRALGFVTISVGGVSVQRKALTFAQWKMQRACAAYTQLNDAIKPEIDIWLAQLGGEALKTPPTHPFVFVNHKLCLK